MCTAVWKWNKFLFDELFLTRSIIWRVSKLLPLGPIPLRSFLIRRGLDSFLVSVLNLRPLNQISSTWADVKGKKRKVGRSRKSVVSVADTADTAVHFTASIKSAALKKALGSDDNTYSYASQPDSNFGPPHQLPYEAPSSTIRDVPTSTTPVATLLSISSGSTSPPATVPVFQRRKTSLKFPPVLSYDYPRTHRRKPASWTVQRSISKRELQYPRNSNRAALLRDLRQAEEFEDAFAWDVDYSSSVCSSPVSSDPISSDEYGVPSSPFTEPSSPMCGISAGDSFLRFPELKDRPQMESRMSVSMILWFCWRTIT